MINLFQGYEEESRELANTLNYECALPESDIEKLMKWWFHAKSKREKQKNFKKKPTIRKARKNFFLFWEEPAQSIWKAVMEIQKNNQDILTSLQSRDAIFSRIQAVEGEREEKISYIQNSLDLNLGEAEEIFDWWVVISTFL